MCKGHWSHYMHVFVPRSGLLWDGRHNHHGRRGRCHLAPQHAKNDWRWMKVYEGIWRYMKVYEGIWRYMKVYEGIWRYMKVYEGIWRYMKVYEGIWSFSISFEGRTCGILNYRPMHAAEMNAIMGLALKTGLWIVPRWSGHMEPIGISGLVWTYWKRILYNHIK